MRLIAQRIYALLTHEYFLYAIVLTICIGTYYARAAVSIATVALGVVGLFTVLQADRRREILRDHSIVALTSVFLVVAISGLISSNTEMWLVRVFTNIPYLAIPAGIWAFGPFDKKIIVRLMLIFIVITSISAAAMMADYAMHFKAYNELYLVGKIIPTPIIHVRYSYFLAVAAICCFGLVMDKLNAAPKAKMTIGAIGIFLAVCTHVLAVRTGILALYGGILTLVVLLIIREKKWQIGIGALLLVVLVAIGSTKFLPSVANKMGYVLHDLKMYTKKVSPEYSDNIRFVSIRHGINIFLENPLFGVGVGDIDDATKAMYESETPSVPKDRRFPPISQFVFWLASFGIVGTAVLIGLLVYPLFRHGRHSYLLWGIYALTAFSFFGETTIQLQLGKTIFLLLIVIVLQWERLGVNGVSDKAIKLEVKEVV